MKNALGSALLRLEMHEQRVVIISHQRIDRVERVGEPRVVLAFSDANHIMPVLSQSLHQPRGQPATVHEHQPTTLLLAALAFLHRLRQYGACPGRNVKPIGDVLLLSQPTFHTNPALYSSLSSLNPVSLSLKRIPRQLYSPPPLLSLHLLPFHLHSHHPQLPHRSLDLLVLSSLSPFLSRQRPYHSRPFDPFRHPRHPPQRLPRPYFQQHPALHTPQHLFHSFPPPYSLSHLPPPVDALSYLCSTGPPSRHVRDVSDLRLSHLHFPRIPAHRSRRPLHHPRVKSM